MIEDATLDGSIRSFYQIRDLDVARDTSLYSLGVKFHFETGSVMGLQAGTTFFAVNDFDVNADDLRPQNPRIPVSTLNTFGEAYLKYDNHGILLKAGRQYIDTPLMGPSDSLVVPVTFFGYRAAYKGIEHLELHAMYMTEVKIRQNSSFDDIGQFVTKRLGVTPANTAGTAAFGAKWENENLKLELWNYQFPDLFNATFLQGDMTFSEKFGVQPFASFQVGKQFDVGDKLLGDVDATLYGVQVGAGKGPVKLTYAFNYLPKNAGNFRNGGFLSPYSFATDALYTNNLDGGLTIKDSAFVGWAHKWIFNYTYQENLLLGFSFTLFDLIKDVGGKDSTEINGIIKYTFQGPLKGLSLLNRIALVESELATEDVIEYRLLLQYVFDSLI